MKKIDEVIKRIEQITLQDGNQYHIEIRELIISKIEQYRNELLNELEKEFENQRRYHTSSEEEIAPIDSFKDGYNACIDDSKQKILEMREEK